MKPPALLQCLFGDDVAGRSIPRKQPADIIHFFHLIFLAGLDRYHVRSYAVSLMQIFAHVLSVDVLSIALLFTRPFDLNQAVVGRMRRSFRAAHRGCL